MTEKILQSRIGVCLIGSGYAALHMVEVEDSALGTYWDVQQTGFGRYKTQREAAVEAINWADSDKIPLADGVEVMAEKKNG